MEFRIQDFHESVFLAKLGELCQYILPKPNSPEDLYPMPSVHSVTHQQHRCMSLFTVLWSLIESETEMKVFKLLYS